MLKALAAARPSRLYVAADGPRSWRKDDKQKCQKVRDLFRQSLGWECEVHELFEEINRGCDKMVVAAVSWFFEHEEKGIILEDDIIPNLDFFKFCDEMLERYKDESHIQSVSGWNYFYRDKSSEFPYSYYFSRLTSSWGWATWRRVWKEFDTEFYYKISVRDMWQAMKKLGFPIAMRRFYVSVFVQLKYKRPIRLDAWDYAFCIHGFLHEKYVVQPMKNLVENIGFNRGDGTHTNNIEEFQMQQSQKIYPLTSPHGLEQAKEWTTRLDGIRVREENLQLGLKTYIHFWLRFFKSRLSFLKFVL